MNLRTIRMLALAGAALAYGGLASAGTPHAPAGSTISNTASVAFDVGGNPQTPASSNTVNIQVDELLDVSVTLQSANPTATLSPAADQPIRFTVTNLGNGSELFNLTANLALGPDFNPTNLEFYIDDGDNVFEPGAGDGAPVTSITLAGEATGTVWMVTDIPAALADGDIGNITMTATSATAAGAPTTGTALTAGAVYTGGGTGGSDAVIGTSNGFDTEAGGYQVANISFTVTKSSAVVNHPTFGTNPVPGATITYTIVVATAGSGTATNVVVTDDAPTDTTYVANSITVNTVAKTDANDGEAAPACNFNVTNPGGIHCALGTLTGVTNNTVTFQVTIN
jgi:uncharacterized repeat protein (TIGR01451 family)